MTATRPTTHRARPGRHRAPKRHQRTRKIALIAATLGLIGLGAAGCASKLTEPFHDAHRGATNSQPADVGTMPDGFSNWADKCDHGNRVYTLFHSDSAYGAISVVPQDPTCKGAAQ